MVAVADNTYSDLTPDQEYEIEKVFKEGYINLSGSKRRYKAVYFVIKDKGKKISIREAYRRYKLAVVMKKLGM